MFLFHYYDRNFKPFRSLTELPFEAAKQILLQQKAEGAFLNPDIDAFLQKRYARDRQLRALFIARGGKPQRAVPIYMTLGEHKQWTSAYEHPAVIKIPLAKFDPVTVSFTYGDSFAVLNPALFGEEEYWNKVYMKDEIIRIVDRYGFPPHIEYDFKRGIYPAGKNIHHHLKYVEAHVWSDAVLEKYGRSACAHCSASGGAGRPQST